MNNLFQTNLSTPLQDTHFIWLNRKAKTTLPANNILRLQASGMYTVLYLKDNTTRMLSRNIKMVYEELPSGIFFRVSRYSVINLTEVKNYIEARGGKIIMCDDSVVEVSIRKKTQFLKKLYELVKTGSKRAH